MIEKIIGKILDKLPPFGWRILFGIAWVGCWIEDEIWTPIWWFFNKYKYIRKDESKNNKI